MLGIAERSGALWTGVKESTGSAWKVVTGEGGREALITMIFFGMMGMFSMQAALVGAVVLVIALRMKVAVAQSQGAQLQETIGSLQQEKVAVVAQAGLLKDQLEGAHVLQKVAEEGRRLAIEGRDKDVLGAVAKVRESCKKDSQAVTAKMNEAQEAQAQAAGENVRLQAEIERLRAEGQDWQAKVQMLERKLGEAKPAIVIEVGETTTDAQEWLTDLERKIVSFMGGVQV